MAEVRAQTFVPLEATPLGDRSAFHGRVQAAPVADLHLSAVSEPGQVVRRTRRLVQRAAADLYEVGVQLRGRGLVAQDGRVAELVPGDLTVYDTARPYELVFERDFENVHAGKNIRGVVVCDRAPASGRAGPVGPVLPLRRARGRAR